jgi:hypothetical protein
MLSQQSSKKPGFAPNPLSNTGLDSQVSQSILYSAKVDWIQGTFRFHDEIELDRFVRLIAKHFKDKLVFNEGKGRPLGRQWNHQANGVAGMLLLYNKPEEEPSQVGRALVSFPAQCLSAIPAWQVQALIKALVVRFGFKCTRFDVAIDDYKKRITFDQVHKALKENNFAGFRRYNYIRNGELGKGNIGFTVYLGSSQSDTMIRFYDKDAESKGRIKSYRWEAQFKDELAQKYLTDWLALDKEGFEKNSPMLLFAMVVNRIKFVERGTEKNVNRMPMLDWWASFISGVHFQVRHSVQALETTYEQKRAWLEIQVAPTLAVLKKVMGINNFQRYMRFLLDIGEASFTHNHQAQIEVFAMRETDARYLAQA